MNTKYVAHACLGIKIIPLNMLYKTTQPYFVRKFYITDTVLVYKVTCNIIVIGIYVNKCVEAYVFLIIIFTIYFFVGINVKMKIAQTLAQTL